MRSVGQGELQEGVGNYSTGITEPKKGVVGENGGDVKQGGNHESLMGQGGEGRVAMD